MSATSENNYQGVLQHPVNSGFDAASTATDVLQGLDLTGQTAVVTGGYAGIGLVTTKALVAAGAEVVVPARDIAKAEKNLAGVPRVTVLAMDLMDPASIDAFAAQFLALDKPLTMLINNAGIMWPPLRRDARGHESQFSTNHLGHFQLTARLWPALKRAKGARVVNLSSWGHHIAPADLLADFDFRTTPYDPLLAYGISKCANILFAVELDKRAQAFGVRAYSVHPGAIGDTDLVREVPPETLATFGLHDEAGNFRHDPYNGAKNPEEGASTSVWAATSPQLAGIGGVYCEDTDVAPLDTEFKGWDPTNMVFTKGVVPATLEPETARQLWTLSEELTGAPFYVE